MAWKGNNNEVPSSESTNNILPNVNQGDSGISEIQSSIERSRDTGEVIRTAENIGSIPKVGPYKKENAIRRDNDTIPNFKVDLIDIDTTIIEYIDKRLDLSVVDGGETIKVPILYASPERWFSVQKDGCLRDNQGKIILPVMLIKRTSVKNNNDLMFFNRHLDYTITTEYNSKNKYDRFDLLSENGSSRGKPPKQVYKIKIPDHVIVEYECIIWTDYIEQNNKVIEKINFATHDYWGLDRYKFRTRIDGYTTDIEVDDAADRNIKSTFTLTVNAYLLPLTIDGVKDTTQKDITFRKVIFDEYNMDDYKTKTNEAPYAYLKKYVSP